MFSYEKVELSEEDYEEIKDLETNYFKIMSSSEYNYIRQRAGLTFADIGKCAVKIGKRFKPYDKSTIFRWLEKTKVTMKAVELLYNCMRHEQFVLLRQEWVYEDRASKKRGFYFRYVE